MNRSEDAVQQALVIAWRELPRLRDPDRFEPWQHRILIRRSYFEARHERDWADNIRVQPIDGPAAPDESGSLADRDELDRGFRRLPPEQRAILVLHHYLGLTPTVDETRSEVEAWVEQQYCESAGGTSCARMFDQSVRLCVEVRDCHPGVLVSTTGREVQAFFTGGIYNGQMVVVTIWRDELDASVALRRRPATHRGLPRADVRLARG